MLAWILEFAGLSPGFLIGGVPGNFGVSARLGSSPFFVVEADEYDTAFFDKRSKFVHYRPRTLILNNLEFDHADIFPDLEAIQRQFHHLIRTVPGSGLMLVNANDSALADVLDMGCWTPVETVSAADFPAQWQMRKLVEDATEFEVFFEGKSAGVVRWEMIGDHNVHNALAAIGAARHAGVPPAHAIEALCSFQGVKRRMEVRGRVDNVTVYDDFAHHPSAIATTLAGLRARVGSERILVLLEPRSNTMRMGVHRADIAPALEGADHVWVYAGGDLGWDANELKTLAHVPMAVEERLEDLVAEVCAQARAGDHILVMSNGGFGGIHQRLLDALSARAGA